jgi:hypothetical protein
VLLQALLFLLPLVVAAVVVVLLRVAAVPLLVAAAAVVVVVVVVVHAAAAAAAAAALHHNPFQQDLSLLWSRSCVLLRVWSRLTSSYDKLVLSRPQRTSLLRDMLRG